MTDSYDSVTGFMDFETRGVLSVFEMVKGASAKRSPLPWRAGGKKQPVSPGAANRAASTNSESPYWRRGAVLPQEPLELFGMPLQIVRSAPSHGGHPDDRVEVPMLPPDHYGCGLGCHAARFTGTLAAVEEHERYHCHFLHDLLPEGLNATFSAATKKR